MISRTHDEFLSTLPARGATVFDETYTPDIPISIHAPREGSDRLPKVFGSGGLCNFYPRSPRGERRIIDAAAVRSIAFLSTLPARGATRLTPISLNTVDGISIHAPREGSDLSIIQMAPSPHNFYPRSPRGERLPHVVYGFI